MNIHFTVYLFLIITCILFLFTIKYKEPFTSTYPCNQDLTDEKYIDHMISHHEVAVYMSENQLHNTKNPILLDILRNLIRLQNYEINLMKDSKIVNKTNNKLNNEMSDNIIKMNKSYHYTQGDFTKPNTPYLSNTYCDSGFFKMSHNKINII
jgi:hypothetical protein